MPNGSLTIIGCGIKFMSHLTIEANTSIINADKVLYLVNEPAMSAWLALHAPQAENMMHAYADHRLRQETYAMITNMILRRLSEEIHLCVVLEGHPVVFAKPALDAVIEAKKQGYTTSILPGISAEDYLFAELAIDPGTTGCHSYEATDFLIYNRACDGYSHLILWQVSVIGMLKSNQKNVFYERNAQLLVNKLQRFYPSDHPITLYEGSQYPHIPSTISTILLRDLPKTTLSRITTVYVPPAHQALPDLSMIQAMQLDQLTC